MTTGLPQEKIVLVGIPVGTKLKGVPLQIAVSNVFEITGIEVQIKKLDPPKIVVVVDNSPAASELNLQKNMVLRGLEYYGIEIIMIKTV